MINVNAVAGFEPGLKPSLISKRICESIFEQKAEIIHAMRISFFMISELIVKFSLGFCR